MAQDLIPHTDKPQSNFDDSWIPIVSGRDFTIMCIHNDIYIYIYIELFPLCDKGDN